MVTAFVRTILLYFIIMLGLRLMGKRQIGELEPTELVLTMLISDLAAVPMQDFGIPLLNGVVPIVTLLALLFGGAMANARYVSKSVDGWCAGVEAALAAAEAEDWEGAREVLGAVYASWDARQTYFHIMVEHAELDAAEALFAVSHSFAESEDGAEFRANTAELLTQLRLLDEMEEISIKNIL